jgi:hypothetical protein
MNTPEEIERQLEIERAILEVLLHGTTHRPGTETLEGIRPYPDWCTVQENRVRALELILDDAREAERIQRHFTGERKLTL